LRSKKKNRMMIRMMMIRMMKRRLIKRRLIKRRLIKRRRKKKRKKTRKYAAEVDKDAFKHCCPRILNINENLAALGCGPSVFDMWQQQRQQQQRQQQRH